MNPSAAAHSFGDDALGDLDGIGIAARIAKGEVSATEVVAAAIARAEKVNPQLNAIQLEHFANAMQIAIKPVHGPFAGVPTFVKDNTDLRGLPTRQGSLAVVATAAKKDSAFARQFLAQGFVVLGKSTLPEFGLNASTEFQSDKPTRNPWNTNYSCGASSGGAAALVASGVVPLAHANDGGGSIRIPAACCGLVGLKPTRGRLIDNDVARAIPVNIIAEGVVSRSVRDTAHFLYHAERYFANRKLPRIGLLEHAAKRRLKIALFLDSVTGHNTDSETRAAVVATASLLQRMGHHVMEIPPPVSAQFVSDFSLYWGFLTFLTARFGKHSFGPGFDPNKLDDFSQGLIRFYKNRWSQTPGMLYRLKRAKHDYAKLFNDVDLVLSPVLGHTTPQLGYLAPTQSFEQLFERLHRYVSFTPWNNAAGGPAMSLPLGTSTNGLPIGVHFSAAHGAEGTLLELAYEIEQAQPWPRVDFLDSSQRMKSGLG